MLHTKFRGNRPASCHQIFISLYLKAFIKNLVQIGTVVSEISSPKGNDRSPENKQVFLNSSQVSKRYFSIKQGSQLCSQL